MTDVQRLTSEEAVQRRTGRGWEEWLALLDGSGAVERKHGEIVEWLMGEHGVSGWWAQTITVTYERERGLRRPGSGRDGVFEASASKTVAVPVERLYEAFVDPAQRERWLPGAVLRERTTQPGRSARFDWEDGSTRVVVGFEAKGAEKSVAALIHEKLPDAAAAERSKSYWRERLVALKELLEA
jgi:uncharacterized protein YndB with AHSA1/START domain